MNRKKIYALVAMTMVTLGASAQYFTINEVPNPVLYLPPYPGYEETRFSVDIKQYFNGKTVRLNNPERAALVKSDVSYGVEPMATIFSPIMGYSIFPSSAPRLYTMLNQGITTAAYGASRAKNYYVRMRPCVRFNEAPYSSETLSEMKRTYSYPSSHAVAGWTTGLLTAAVNPHKQDTLLTRGYDYGQSRVLGGMHWQSDVSDARLVASACLARMLFSPVFKSHLVSARNEINRINADSLGIAAPNYNSEHYFDTDSIANPVVYMPAPPSNDEASAELAYDMSQYVWGKSVRNTEVGIKAKFDINTDFDVLVGEFARVIDEPITAESTPALYTLLQQAVVISDNACRKAQDHYQRQRPFDFFKEAAYTYENPEEFTSTGSYPATHAARTWTTALLMVAMSPANQDSILKVGYDLGQSDVITGINWQSDVDAGRVIASVAFSRMLSNPNFVALIEQAQNEFAAKTQMIVTDQDDIGIDATPAEGPLFTIDGRLATDESRGILVGRDRKIMR